MFLLLGHRWYSLKGDQIKVAPTAGVFRELDFGSLDFGSLSLRAKRGMVEILPVIYPLVNVYITMENHYS